MRKTMLLKDQCGSVLVGTVALSIIMAIAGIGFLQVATISVNNDTEALENDLAFHAAESGIWVGARWLRGYTDFLALTANSPDIGPFGATPISINGRDVYVTIPVDVGADGVPVAQIVANVYKGGSTPGEATFKKRISVGEVRCGTFGTYGTFYDGYQSTSDGDRTSGQWNTGATWNGWGGGRIFNGRFHMNSLTNKLYDNTPRFNGLVTVSQGCGQFDYDTGHTAHHDNDYNFGVEAVGWTPTVPELDQIFTDRYVPNTDQIALNISGNDAKSILADASIPAGDKIVLPRSYRDEGDGPYKYRPTLYFDGQNAFYKYRTSSGTYATRTYGLAAGSSFDGRIFIDTCNNLNVYSTANGVTGRVTVVTPPGKSIVPVGNLVTSDYDYATGKVDSTSNNMIGLITGGYIAFNKTWKKRFTGTGIDTTKYVSEMTTGGGAPGPADGVGTLHMSASIMAVENFNDVLPDGSGGTRTYAMKGCEWWDGMWMQQSAGGAFTDTSNHLEDYGYKLYGNHILGGYSRTIWPGSGDRGCGGTLEFTHDQRMVKRNLQPPGFPGVRSTDNLLVLEIRNWSEHNVY
ncbi:MAG: hypothetical protein JW699_08150 [Chitinispirillaceae bacterium]|nr:hypothetical protein [Chitinispirillaceae bacterium]